MNLALALVLLAFTACVPDLERRTPRDQPDAAAVDDPPPDAECDSPTRYYSDGDGDGHGDPSSFILACRAPAGAVATDDDCDDAAADVHPGATEACDGVDNDCSTATGEACPAGCTPMKQDAHVYLFCANPTSWTNARTACVNAGMRLVQIDSAAENTFVRQEATSRFGGGEIHIGASDAAQENTWRWDGGDVFWVGDEGGAPAGGLFAAWQAGEPNGTSDCAEMRADTAWYDNDCNDNQRYVCRK